ncbi:hypothetical protein BACCIP111895_03122 [Neobacillus rhizosphaerae]|uniref:Uncharacterized protein n=1 Tax=Neobacillus rhizosphaerae TaxID=2880965 RepID=A0ABM9ETF3_9BACI|nr:hypothetical protein [Neobacillus rhizosphaerae]CAH2715938.1 hypothetical protein BACCIP111895_03122 [Neobacillus rhizosphaerae]
MKKVMILMMFIILFMGIGTAVYTSPLNQSVSAKLQQWIDPKSDNNKKDTCGVNHVPSENSSSKEDNCQLKEK